MKAAILGALTCISVLWLSPSTTARANESADAVRGHQKAAMCIGCHGIPGYRASFPEVHRVPMISGQSAKYIAAALEAYRKGERKHPTMRSIAGSLSDADIADLAAFYAGPSSDAAASSAPAAPSAEVAALLQRGNCASCHGESLNHPIDGAYPKLAGQHPDYLFVALKAYKTVDNRNVGRSNPIMGAQAKPFSNAELRLLASYIGSLQGDLRTVPNPKLH